MQSPTPVPPTPSTQHLEFSGRNGPILIGLAVDCLLFGLLIAQIFIYMRGQKWHRDSAIMQILVYTLCSTELFRLVVVLQNVWKLFIEFDGHPAWSSSLLAVALPSLAGFESAIVQVFFAWRIWSMKRDEKRYWMVSAIIVTIAAMQAAGSIGVSHQLGKTVAQMLDPNRTHEISLFTTIWLVGSFVCDLFIVFAMTKVLIEARKEAMFRETEKLINYLLRLTVESGALTVLAAAMMLGLHLRYPKETYCLGILYILGGLYTNIFLYLLNGRQKPGDSRNNEISLHLAPISHITHTVSLTSQSPEGQQNSTGRSSKE